MKMKKYNKISKNDVLKLFKEQTYLTKDNIVKQLNTSLYQVLIMIDDLVDDNKIELVQIESKFNVPVMKYKQL
jgi:ethanolamine utilization protein EutA (predicted chaperonin)